MNACSEVNQAEFKRMISPRDYLWENSILISMLDLKVHDNHDVTTCFAWTQCIDARVRLRVGHRRFSSETTRSAGYDWIVGGWSYWIFSSPFQLLSCLQNKPACHCPVRSTWIENFEFMSFCLFLKYFLVCSFSMRLFLMSS